MQAPPTLFYSLHCAGIKLAKKDGLFGKSDPFVVIKRQDGVPVAFSEIIKDNLNPAWKPIELDVNAAGGMNASVTVTVTDYDDDGGHDLIGSFTCSVQELVTTLNRERELHDNRGKKAGKFVVQRAEQQQKSRPQAVEVVFTAKGLPAMDGIMGKVDPFLQVLAFPPNRHSADPFLAAMTKYQKKTYTPTWEPIALTEHICGGYEAPLVLRVFDYDADGTHDFVGEARTTLREIVSAAPKFTLINPGLKGKGGYKNSGIVEVARHAPVAPTADMVPHSITVQMKGHKLTNKDGLGGKSDPYLKIVHDSHTVHKTETRNNDLEPVWSTFTLNVSECGGMDHPLSWEVFDHDKHTKDDLIGKSTFSLRRLSFYDKNPVVRLVDQKRVGSLGYKNSGFLVISSVTLNHGPAGGHVPQGGMAPQQGYPPQQGGYPPQQGGYPPQQGGYPPQGGNPYGGYPPQQGGYAPPQQGGYPPQQGGYPPQGGNPYGGYPPQQGGYAPPQQGGYPPQQGGYPPQQGGYPPQGGNPYGGYPPQGGNPYGGH